MFFCNIVELDIDTTSVSLSIYLSIYTTNLYRAKARDDCDLILIRSDKKLHDFYV